MWRKSLGLLRLKTRFARQSQKSYIVTHRLSIRPSQGLGTGQESAIARTSSSSYAGDLFGAWRSLASAPGLGPGGRRFESSRPDLWLRFGSCATGRFAGLLLPGSRAYYAPQTASLTTRAASDLPKPSIRECCFSSTSWPCSLKASKALGIAI